MAPSLEKINDLVPYKGNMVCSNFLKGNIHTIPRLTEYRQFCSGYIQFLLLSYYLALLLSKILRYVINIRFNFYTI